MRPVRLELTAPRLKGGCSTTELRAQKNAGLIKHRVKPNTNILPNIFSTCKQSFEGLTGLLTPYLLYHLLWYCASDLCLTHARALYYHISII